MNSNVVSAVFLLTLFLVLGSLFYRSIAKYESFKDKCNQLGGQVISGRGPSLCVKDGLIVDHE